MTGPALQALIPLAGRHHVLLAVSGGSDSTALLVLSARQIKSIPNPPRLTAITIDHGLRHESAAEALLVGQLCRRLGVDHLVVKWIGEKPATGIQAAAREARRTLIAGAAGRIGADIVVTGHTFDDQRETVFMRNSRGPGPGLAGIAPGSLAFNDEGNGAPIWFVRPLLGVLRQELRDYLIGEGIEWVEDPSNANVEFERIAVRQRLSGMAQASLHGLDRQQADAAEKRRRLAQVAALEIVAHARQIMPGVLLVAPEFFAAEADGEKLLALRTLMSFAAGVRFLADETHARLLFETAFAHAGAVGRKAERMGAGGVLADIRASGAFLMQERRRGASNTQAFAGRYRLTGEASGFVATAQGSAKLVPVPASLVRHAQLSEPVYGCADEGAMSAADAFKTGRRLRLLLNPWPDLVPSFDLPLANALAALAGTHPLPQMPL
jgi:tRNA(Ile)-lysidine synthase